MARGLKPVIIFAQDTAAEALFRTRRGHPRGRCSRFGARGSEPVHDFACGEGGWLQRRLTVSVLSKQGGDPVPPTSAGVAAYHGSAAENPHGFGKGAARASAIGGPGVLSVRMRGGGVSQRARGCRSSLPRSARVTCPRRRRADSDAPIHAGRDPDRPDSGSRLRCRADRHRHIGGRQNGLQSGPGRHRSGCARSSGRRDVLRLPDCTRRLPRRPRNP